MVEVLEDKCENAEIVMRDLGLYRCKNPGKCSNQIQPFIKPENYCKKMLQQQYESVFYAHS